MLINDAKQLAEDLIQCSRIAFVGSIDVQVPNIKAMLVAKRDGLKSIWFSTNTSSRRVEQFLENPNACVYFCDQKKFVGLLLVGKMEVRQDEESRKLIWSDGDEQYYPKGVSDPDYTVLHFITERVNIYHDLDNIDILP